MKIRLTARQQNILTILFLLGIICYGFFLHLRLFSQTEYVNGTDGGFYAYKTRELIEEGTFTFSLGSPPVIFLTSALFAKLFGVFNGVKIATTLYSVLLGISIFILTRYITKSKKAGLVAAFFVIFNPMSLRIAADIRKNAAALFFIPLIIYFVLKFFEERMKTKSILGGWKYAIPLAIVGALGVLSHSSIITVWFATLAYFAFYFGIKKRLEMREFVPVLAADLAIIALMILFYDKISSSLETIAAPPGPVGLPQLEELNIYILPLAITAVPGILLALRKRSRGDIFSLAWLVLSFLLTLSQVVGPSEYWRFALIMLVPLTIFVGYSFDWLLNRARWIGLIILLVTGIITTRQLFMFGRSNPQMMPQLNEQILSSIKAASDQVGENSYVYTSSPHHNYYWIRYFFGSNTRRQLEGSLEDINDLISQGRDVYFIEGIFDMGAMLTEVLPEGESTDAPSGKVQGEMDINSPTEGEEENDLPPKEFESDPALQGKYLETVYEDDNVQLLKLKSEIAATDANKLIKLATIEGDKRPEASAYEFGRLRYLSTYLILPYETINVVNPPYLPLWQIQLGFPLSLLIIGLVASLLLKIKFGGNVAKAVAITIGVTSVAIIYGLAPPIFWGDKQTAMYNGGSPPPTDGQEEKDSMDSGGDGYPCGDGICDQAEREDPTLCPQDCD